MAKSNRTGRSKGDTKHVRLYETMLRSAAYQALNVYERCALIELMRLHNGSNNGELFLSVRLAADLLGCGKTTAAKALHGLCDKGFARPCVKGDFDWKMRHATTWILTEYQYMGQRPTRDFAQWAPTEKQKPIPLRGQPVLRRGQMARNGSEASPICPMTRADGAKINPDLSLRADTVKLPFGEASDGERGRSAQPTASAALGPHILHSPDPPSPSAAAEPPVTGSAPSDSKDASRRSKMCQLAADIAEFGSEALHDVLA